MDLSSWALSVSLWKKSWRMCCMRSCAWIWRTKQQYKCEWQVPKDVSKISWPARWKSIPPKLWNSPRLTVLSKMTGYSTSCIYTPIDLCLCRMSVRRLGKMTSNRRPEQGLDVKDRSRTNHVNVQFSDFVKRPSYLENPANNKADINDEWLLKR